MAPTCNCSLQQKCMKPGPLTRNGYLNFLRDFRMKNCGLSAVETVIQGAKKWRSMPLKEKSKYIEMAQKQPKTPRRVRNRMSGTRVVGRRMLGLRKARGSRKPLRIKSKR